MGFEQRKQERQALVQHLLAQDWKRVWHAQVREWQDDWQAIRS